MKISLSDGDTLKLFLMNGQTHEGIEKDGINYSTLGFEVLTPENSSKCIGKIAWDQKIVKDVTPHSHLSILNDFYAVRSLHKKEELPLSSKAPLFRGLHIIVHNIQGKTWLEFAFKNDSALITKIALSDVQKADFFELIRKTQILIIQDEQRHLTEENERLQERTRKCNNALHVVSMM